MKETKQQVLARLQAQAEKELSPADFSRWMQDKRWLKIPKRVVSISIYPPGTEYLHYMNPKYTNGYWWSLLMQKSNA